MSDSRPGRPRAQKKMRPGASGREEILDAAAELFTTQGYAQTSTRAIADAVGIRQSSLYHHFPTKDDILEALLADTVAGSLGFARRLTAGLPADDDGEARLERAARLYALSLYDGTQLCAARWNLGVLYHLPEARSERFAAFLELRSELRSIYALLSPPDLPGSGDLVFRLVESLISLRADGLATAESAQETADASIRLLGTTADPSAIRALAKTLA